MMKNVGFLVASGLGLGACGSAETAASSGAESVLYAECAQTAATQAQYFARQGQRLQGLSGPGLVVQGARIGCQRVSGLTTSTGDLRGSFGGRALGSADFLGAALQVEDTDGVGAEVAVAGVTPDSMDTSGQTSLFTLMMLDPTTGLTRNVCAPDPDGLSAAIPLRGSWDASGTAQSDGSLQLYCTSGVVAKCLRWGYRPWQSINGTSLKEVHQACTRMARADYCGEGETHTLEGTQIDLYDKLGVHSPSTLSLFFEAAWTPQGAYCVARSRWLSLTGLLSDSCRSKFELDLEASPVNSSDRCFAHRIGSPASTALIANRAGINININIGLGR